MRYEMTLRIWLLVISGMLFQQVVMELFDNNTLSAANLAQAMLFASIIISAACIIKKNDWDWGDWRNFAIVAATLVVYSALNEKYTFSLTTKSGNLDAGETTVVVAAGVATVVALCVAAWQAHTHKKLKWPQKSVLLGVGCVAAIYIINTFVADNGPGAYLHFHHGLVGLAGLALFVYIGGESWGTAHIGALVFMGVTIHGASTWGVGDFEFKRGSSGEGFAAYVHGIALVIVLIAVVVLNTQPASPSASPLASPSASPSAARATRPYEILLRL